MPATMKRPDRKNIPKASWEQTNFLEQKLVKLCTIYMGKIGALSEKRFGALVQRAMSIDMERSILLAQVPHITYHHSKWFKKWEKRLWRKINKRLKTVSEDF